MLIALPVTGVYVTGTVPSSVVVTVSLNKTLPSTSTIVTLIGSLGTLSVLFLRVIIAVVSLCATGIPGSISTVVFSFATLNVSLANASSYPELSAGVKVALTVTFLPM